MTCRHDRKGSGFGYLSCLHTSNSPNRAKHVVWKPVQARGGGGVVGALHGVGRGAVYIAGRPKQTAAEQ